MLNSHSSESLLFPDMAVDRLDISFQARILRAHDLKVSLPEETATCTKVALMHKGVIVAGMHRSGTSAMTRVLNLLGCTLPEDLIGPNLGNERGHWESTAIVELNDQIFMEAGTSWDDWMSVNSDWRASPLRVDAVQKASQLVHQHSQLGPLFAMKDPRISKIVDIWLDAFDKVDVEPTLIIMLRNPIEVANSLERRDLMSPAYSHLLWLRYMLDVELYSRGRKRIICSFDQLLDNWPTVVGHIRSGTELFFPRNSPLIHNEIDQFIDKHDRHYDVRPDLVVNSPNLSLWLRDAYAIFLRWSRNGEDTSDHSDLDAIRNSFDQSAPAFSRLILPGTQSGLAGAGERLRLELQKQLDQARLASSEAERVTEDSRSHLAEAQAKEEALTAQIEQQAQAALHLEAEIAALRDEAAQQDIAAERHAREQAEVQLVQAQEALAQAHDQLDEVKSRLATAESALIQRREELAQLWEEMEVARLVIGEIDTLREEKKAQDVKLADAAEALLRLTVEQQASKEAEKAARSELTQELQARCLAEARLQALAEQLAEVRLQRDQAETARSLAERQPGGHDVETSKLTQRLPDIQAEQTQALAKPNADVENQLTVLLQQRDQDVGAAEAARSVAERQLNARFTEIATLTKLLRDASTETDASKVHAQWLRRVNAAAAGFPRWWALMPSVWRYKHENVRFAQMGLFDAEKYLQLYPDVAASGMNPLKHYILHGMDEKRRNPV